MLFEECLELVNVTRVVQLSFHFLVSIIQSHFLAQPYSQQVGPDFRIIIGVIIGVVIEIIFFILSASA